jgi:pimeloyl-ACP methyl ester carboxylesterase
MKATWLAMRITGRFSRRLGGYFAARLWFTPWRVPVSDRALAKQQRWLADTTPIDFEVDGRVVKGFTAGTGPIIMLVHGWGERAASMGAFIAPLVRDGYRVVGIDLPGHGATSSGQTNIFELSRALRGVEEQLGGIHGLIAHSMGGYVSTVALGVGLSPDVVVLISPASEVTHALEKFTGLFKLPPKAARGLRETIERRFGAGVWERLDVVSLVRRIRIPALIVHDSNDPQIDLTDSETLAAAWHGAHLITTEGLGHTKIVRDPQVIDQVAAFLVEASSPLRQELVSASVRWN